MKVDQVRENIIFRKNNSPSIFEGHSREGQFYECAPCVVRRVGVLLCSKSISDWLEILGQGCPENKTPQSTYLCSAQSFVHPGSGFCFLPDATRTPDSVLITRDFLHLSGARCHL